MPVNSVDTPGASGPTVPSLGPQPGPARQPAFNLNSNTEEPATTPPLSDRPSTSNIFAEATRNNTPNNTPDNTPNNTPNNTPSGEQMTEQEYKQLAETLAETLSQSQATHELKMDEITYQGDRARNNIMEKMAIDQLADNMTKLKNAHDKLSNAASA